MSPEADDVLFDYDGAAAFLKCSRRTLERWVSQRKVPSFMGPGGRLFSKRTLIAWAAEKIEAANRRRGKLEVVA
jgi:excisionase family DNA binding protein